MSDSDEKDNSLGLHFEHEWEREAWAAEMAATRERKARLRKGEAEDTGKILDFVERLKPTLSVDKPRECGFPPFGAALRDDHECCDRLAHYRMDPVHKCPVVVRRCPALATREIQAHCERERERLKGELAQIGRFGSAGFDGVDLDWGTGAALAWKAARDFSEGRPPVKNVFFAGTTGLAKTRLLLASHFALLTAGVRSMYVRSPELRQALDDARSYDEELRTQGLSLVERMVRTQAVHLDDLGNVDDDERKRGQFAEGLKSVLDRSGGAWMVATNLTWDEAVKHPDVGMKVLSRVVSGATVVKLEGKDYRIAHSERA